MLEHAVEIRTEGQLAELLQSFELQLMEPAFRRNRASVAALLSEDFREFGASGRFWTRDAILEMMVSEEAYIPSKLEDFAIKQVSPDAVLVTYRAVREAMVGVSRRETLRSSLWIQSAGGWRIAFHQGTIVPNA
jgi:glyoxylase I family protein